MRSALICTPVQLNIKAKIYNYYTEGFVKDVKATIDNPKAGEFQITLLCPDPIIYEKDPNAIGPLWVENIVNLGETATVVNNASNLAVAPVITISNSTIQLDGVNISNETTLQVMEISDYVNIGDTLVVDMLNRKIVLNDSIINNARSADSAWWMLNPGNNNIKLTSGLQILEPIPVTIRYKKGVVGI